jgi:hypothetical protein
MGSKTEKYPYRLGKYNFIDDKIRIITNESVTSVLFEDISSFSFYTCERKQPIYLLTGIVLSLILTNFRYKEIGDILSGLTFIGSFAVFFIYKKRWDNIIIETRGGKLIEFSVSEGDGINVVEEIEECKRKRSSI